MAQLIFTHDIIGAFEFPQEKIPLISRRVTAQRTNEQSGGHRRIDITFNGYVSGISHPLIMAQHQQLIEICNAYTVKVFYHDGINVIMDNIPVYMDGIAEIEQWRQRLGDYTITGYYFDKLDNTGDNQLVDFSSVNGAFEFEQQPIIGISKKKSKSASNAHDYLPSGQAVGEEIALQLIGEICGTSHNDLLAIKESLELAFSKDGTLNYGSLSFACHVNGIQWAPSATQDYWPFAIDLTYYLTGVKAFECSVNYSRVTLNPIIHENPNCPNLPIVVNRYNQGQWVDYSFHIEGETLATIRTLLLNEVSAIVAPGGYEPVGGKEAHNIQEPKIDLNFTKFYQTPILNNIEGNP